MMLKRIENLQDYSRYLQANPNELRDLQDDVLIGVTKFFRDPETFAALKSDIFPRIFEKRQAGQQVRIWVAGCSTGEEVYSIAMTLLEYLSAESVELPIQIFGTDASERSVEKARLGIFPESVNAEVDRYLKPYLRKRREWEAQGEKGNRTQR